jgi:hypothetical protein
VLPRLYSSRDYSIEGRAKTHERGGLASLAYSAVSRHVTSDKVLTFTSRLGCFTR